METAIDSTQAPVYFAVPRTRVSTWAIRVQGTSVSALGAHVAGMTAATSTTPANAAKGATRKGATGGEAFEDPV